MDERKSILGDVINMAVKTNYSKNGRSYFRVSAVLGTDSNGKKIVKEFYGKSKSEAEAKKREYLDGIRSGLSINRKNLSLGDLMHIWLFEIVRVSDKIKPSTFERYEGIYRRYIKNSPLYLIKLDSIRTLDIQRYYNSLSSEGKSKNIILALNKLLKQFLFYAVDEGYLIKNPCVSKRIVIPGENTINKEVDHFTDDELKILMNNLDGNKYKEVILLSLGTGLRRGEILALTWDDIDLDNNMISVSKSLSKVYIIEGDETRERKQIIQSPKSVHSIRTIPFPESLKHLFRDLQVRQKINKLRCGKSYINSNYVFVSECGDNVELYNLANNWNKLLKDLAIPHKKFHALRHTYATKLFEKGVPLKTVSELLGHSSIDITADIYTHVMPKEKTNAVEKLNSFFAENL